MLWKRVILKAQIKEYIGKKNFLNAPLFRVLASTEAFDGTYDAIECVQASMLKQRVYNIAN